VTAIQGNRVRIGLAAPRSMRVDREEVHQRRSRSTCTPLPSVPNAPSHCPELV
jgi:sRNA-binding carbon storage regulator CsrA